MKSGLEKTLVAGALGLSLLSGCASVNKGTPDEALNQLAFYDNNLESVVLSRNIKAVRRWTFDSNNLTDINLPANIERIDDSAFGDNNIASVKISKEVYVDDDAFDENCNIIRF